MRARSLASLVALVAVIVVLSLASAPRAGQAQAAVAKKGAASKSWTPPRTPWGDPDVQGIFTNRDGAAQFRSFDRCGELRRM
jgi:hypothetical protein